MVNSDNGDSDIYYMNWFLPSFVSKNLPDKPNTTLKNPQTLGFDINWWQNKGNHHTSKLLLILYLFSLGILQKQCLTKQTFFIDLNNAVSAETCIFYSCTAAILTYSAGLTENEVSSGL